MKKLNRDAYDKLDDLVSQAVMARSACDMYYHLKRCEEQLYAADEKLREYVDAEGTPQWIKESAQARMVCIREELTCVRKLIDRVETEVKEYMEAVYHE